MSAWSQLEQLLTCAICLDRFRNPKLLPCQHTFCGEPCMEGLVDYARRQIKCPECRAEHRIPYNGVQSFPNNVTLARFLDLHRGITGEEPDPLPSQMDRCGVCGEKAFCLRCAHCDKKVCEECRTAHLDILRREINRMNTQVRRGLGKLTEQAQQTGKTSERLAVMSSQIRDEITESVRRFIKDLKDKETKLLADLDEFTLSESKNSEKLNDDLDLELATISSNCELVEEHVTEQDEWTDVELMEYKDIFLKTLEFLRNLDPDTMDLSRKIKYIQKVDLDTLRRNAADFGEIKITAPAASLLTSGLLSPSDSSSNLVVPGSNLIRSQSDHRLAAQFASSGRTAKDALQRSYLDVTGGNRYGSDSDRERGSSPPGRRGERFGSVRSYGARGSELSYTRGWERPGDSEYEPSNSSNFRSRFMRERIRERGGGEDHSFEEHDTDLTSSHRVRFQEEAAASQARTKLFDTEEMANLRAPLSGIIKLADSPHVMERLHQNEMKAKQKEAEAKENGTSNTSTPFVPAPTQPIQPRPTRQISEDEIEKQKKQNKVDAAQQASQPANSTNTTVATQGQTPKSNPVPKTGSLAVESTAQSARSNTSPSASVANRRVQALQKEDTRSIRSNSSDDGANSGPESGDVTCDDDTPSATSAAASALNSVSRRRIYASSHSSSGGGTGTGSLANSMSASVDHAGDTGRSKPSSAQPSATNRLLHATVGPDISITSDKEQQHPPSGATQGDSSAEPTEAPRPISPLPSPSPTPSQASETSDTTAETTSEATSETDTETETTTEVTTAALPPHSALPPLTFQSYAANENTFPLSASPASSENTASNEETADNTEDESVTTSAASSVSASPVPPPHSPSPLSESSESTSASPLPTTSTATLTIPTVTVKGPGGVDVEIVKKTSNVTIMRRTTSKDSYSSSFDSDDEEEEEEEFDDEATIQNASNVNLPSNDYEPTLESLPESIDTINGHELNNATMNDSNYEDVDEISDSEVGNETEEDGEGGHEEVDHDRLDLVENVENISQWHTNELNGGSRLPPLDFNNNSDRHKEEERESSDEESDEEEDEEEVEDEMVDAEEGRDFDEDEGNSPDVVNGNGSDDSNYYQSSYYGSNPPSARSSLSRFGTEEPTFTGSTSYYPKPRNRKYSRDEDAGLGDTTAAVPSSPSYYSSSYSGAARRTSLSRTSTLDDEDDDAPSSGVRSYYSTARKQFQAQQAALAALNAQTNDTTRYGSSGSTGGSSSYFRNRLSKSRSSHAIAAYDDSDDDSPVNASASNPLSPSSGSYRSRFGFGSSIATAAAAPDTSEQFASSASAGRRTSRSGYTYRTRILSRDPSPEEEAAGSVTQYLINKYGTRSGSSRPSMLSKSKSSHVIYGRSLSSSDEDNVTTAATAATAVPSSPYRRTSRDSESSYKSTTTPSSYGLTYPRQIYQQKRRMLMKIGSRGTNPSCFTWPRGVACAPDNSIVVADSSNHRVQYFDFSGRFQFEFGSYGSGEGEFDCLAGVAVNRMGHFIVSDRYNHRIQVFDGTGRFLRTFGSEGRSDGRFSYPWGVACDALGFIYLCDKENHRIQVFQSDGTFVGKFGSIGSRSGMLEHPHYIAVSNTNRIIVSDNNNHRICIFDINGRAISTFGSEGSADGQFKFPRGVAVDENGFIIVGDSGNNRVQVFNPDGTFLKSFGSWGSGEGEFKGLEGVAIDSNSRILVCDRENHRIQIF